MTRPPEEGNEAGPAPPPRPPSPLTPARAFLPADRRPSSSGAASVSPRSALRGRDKMAPAGPHPEEELRHPLGGGATLVLRARHFGYWQRRWGILKAAGRRR